MPRGRVKDEEQHRCWKNNLCLYCRKSNHTIAKCPATMKGWAAVLPSKTTTEMSTPEPTKPAEPSQLNEEATHHIWCSGWVAHKTTVLAPLLYTPPHYPPIHFSSPSPPPLPATRSDHSAHC